jgi:predicted translin family RNA/ssDNA-binding protein
VEYLLGIADLSGELMRMAIRSVSSGSLDDVYKLLNPIKDIYNSFVKFGSISRELPRKVNVLRQSMMKVEAACYTVQIRGSEFPKHMLADLLHSQPEEGSFHVDDDMGH